MDGEYIEAWGIRFKARGLLVESSITTDQKNERKRERGRAPRASSPRGISSRNDNGGWLTSARTAPLYLSCRERKADAP